MILPNWPDKLVFAEELMILQHDQYERSLKSVENLLEKLGQKDW